MISIITPTYNRAHLISRAIESVINQSYTDWELLIVDDGSKDHTKDVVENYAREDKRIRYFFLENGGAPRARNFGIYKAKGDYILFLDSDDEITPDKLRLHQQAFDNNKDADVSVSEVLRKKHETGAEIYIQNIEPKNFLPVEFVNKKVTWKIHAPVWRKNFVLQEGGFDVDLSSSQDFEFYTRLILKEPKAVYLNKALSIINDYAVKDDQAKIRGSGHSLRSLKNHLRSRNIARVFTLKSNIPSKYKIKILLVIFKHWGYCMKTAFKISPAHFFKLVSWYFQEGLLYKPHYTIYKNNS